MSYQHDGRRPVVIRGDPIDPDGGDEFFFVLGGAYDVTDPLNPIEIRPPWLRSGESVTGTSAIVVNGTVTSGPTHYATRTEEGTNYELREVYGIEVDVTATGGNLTVTLRKTTDGKRTDHDHTLICPIRQL